MYIYIYIKINTRTLCSAPLFFRRPHAQRIFIHVPPLALLAPVTFSKSFAHRSHHANDVLGANVGGGARP